MMQRSTVRRALLAIYCCFGGSFAFQTRETLCDDNGAIKSACRLRESEQNLCEQLGFVFALRRGCFQCVDRRTCDPTPISDDKVADMAVNLAQEGNGEDDDLLLFGLVDTSESDSAMEQELLEAALVAEEAEALLPNQVIIIAQENDSARDDPSEMGMPSDLHAGPKEPRSTVSHFRSRREPQENAFQVSTMELSQRVHSAENIAFLMGPLLLVVLSGLWVAKKTIWARYPSRGLDVEGNRDDSEEINPFCDSYDDDEEEEEEEEELEGEFEFDIIEERFGQESLFTTEEDIEG